jgi:hypothetical protein
VLSVEQSILLATHLKILISDLNVNYSQIRQKSVSISLSILHAPQMWVGIPNLGKTLPVGDREPARPCEVLPCLSSSDEDVDASFCSGSRHTNS